MFTKKTSRLVIILLLGILIFSSGCNMSEMGFTTVQMKNKKSNAAWGTGIGAAVGAGAGALTGNTGLGAFAGALVGGTAGYAIGGATENDKEELSKITNMKMDANAVIDAFEKLSISKGYSKTVTDFILDTESGFPGSLYWFNKKGVLEHEKKVQLKTGKKTSFHHDSSMERHFYFKDFTNSFH